MDLEWFFKMPGLFITGGIVLILIALLVFILGSKKDNKSNKEETKTSEEASVPEMTNTNTVDAASVAMPTTPQEPVTAEPVAPIPVEPVAVEPIAPTPIEPVAIEPVPSAPTEPVATEQTANTPIEIVPTELEQKPAGVEEI